MFNRTALEDDSYLDEFERIAIEKESLDDTMIVLAKSGLTLSQKITALDTIALLASRKLELANKVQSLVDEIEAQLITNAAQQTGTVSSVI